MGHSYDSAVFALGLVVCSSPLFAEGREFKIESLIATHRADVAWLAADQREGRALGTPGIEDSAEYLIKRFKDLGIPGAYASHSYRQTFELTVKIEGEATMVREGVTYTSSADPMTSQIVPLEFSSSAEVEGQIVAVGYGIVSSGKRPDEHIDDYRGKDVRGKIVVMKRFLPEDSRLSNDSEQKARLSDLNFKAFLARERGASAVIVVDVPPAGVTEAPLPAMGQHAQISEIGIPVVAIRGSIGTVLFEKPGKVKIKVANRRERKPSSNIVAVIRADGAKLSDHAIIVGAHYDHLGMGAEGSLEPGKVVIHNGADDNASGTAALLSIGSLLRSPKIKLKHDVYLIAFTGEESGLLGSRHFVSNLPDSLQAKNILMMINLDMIGRMRDRKVFALGAESSKDWSGLILPVCAQFDVHCQLQGSGYGPSDHTSFYTAGIPVVHFFTGAHVDYHQSGDDAEKVDSEGAVKIAAIVAGLVEDGMQLGRKLDYQKREEQKIAKGDARLSGASLGTIPVYAESESDQSGMLVADVRPGGAADVAGIRRGDRITMIGNSKILSVRDLMYVLQFAIPGERALVAIERGGALQHVAVKFDPPKARRPVAATP